MAKNQKMELSEEMVKKLETKSKEGFKIIVELDTETTGLEENDRILQVAYGVFLFDPKTKNFEKVLYREENITPPVDIKPEAAAVHGIWYTDLKNAPNFEDSKSNKELRILKDMGAYFVAHNAFFDANMLKKEDIDWDRAKIIDTLRLVKHKYKNNEKVLKYSLQYLRYLFDYDRNGLSKIMRDFNVRKIQAHTALSDIVVLHYLVKELFTKYSFDEILNMAHSPVLMDEITFGRVFPKGTKISEAVLSTYEQYGRKKQGYDYLNWALKNMELDFDKKYSIAYFITKEFLNGRIKEERTIHDSLWFAKIFIPDFDQYLYKGMTEEKIKAYRINLLYRLEEKLNNDLKEAKEANDQEKVNSILNKFNDLEFAKYYLLGK
jgi:exodeoxyribonuclease X